MSSNLISFQQAEEQFSNSQFVPIEIVKTGDFSEWMKNQTAHINNWIKSLSFTSEPGKFICLPSEQGLLDKVLWILGEPQDFWLAGALPSELPEGFYCLSNKPVDFSSFDFCLAWDLGSYHCSHFRASKPQSRLRIPETVEENVLLAWSESLQSGRDWINLPANVMTPDFLADTVQKIAQRYGGLCTVVRSREELAVEYPAVYAVGKGADLDPCFIDMSWGNPSHPNITLVGKGVCFDSGGLDIKPAAGMRLMKKDMSGAAHALVLSQMIMQQRLPVRLRLIIPAVENAVSSTSYRPGDVIKTRSGLQVEIHNTDAEGRMILCDALTAAVENTENSPELLIDFASLTGASAIALGPDLPAFYTNQSDLHAEVLPFSTDSHDPIWPMPLHKQYESYLKSDIADCVNAASVGLAGSITAALFLSKFVPENVPWMHFDLCAWHAESRPGRPRGGEIFAVRGVFAYLQARFQQTLP